MRTPAQLEREAEGAFLRQQQVYRLLTVLCRSLNAAVVDNQRAVVERWVNWGTWVARDEYGEVLETESEWSGVDLD